MKRSPHIDLMPTGWMPFFPLFLWYRCRDCGMEWRRESGSYWIDGPWHVEGRDRYRCEDCTTEVCAQWLERHATINGRPISDYASAPARGGSDEVA